jgi:hypothetical protein
MCILLILRDRIDGWPLVVGSNRDEFRDRPWDPPRVDGGVLAPRDRRAGGTWVGVSRAGLLVAVTNRPEPAFDSTRPSRGTLAMDLLRCRGLEGALDLLRRDLALARRNAFQILLGTAETAVVGVHPGPDGEPLELLEVPEGLHTLTNLRGLDELRAGSALAPVDRPAGSGLEEALAGMRAVLSLHEDRGPGPPDLICKHGSDRGTLSSTIVALPASGGVPPVFLMASGPPCEAAWEDVGMELGPLAERPSL